MQIRKKSPTDTRRVTADTPPTLRAEISRRGAPNPSARECPRGPRRYINIFPDINFLRRRFALSRDSLDAVVGDSSPLAHVKISPSAEDGCIFEPGIRLIHRVRGHGAVLCAVREREKARRNIKYLRGI